MTWKYVALAFLVISAVALICIVPESPEIDEEKTATVMLGGKEITLGGDVVPDAGLFSIDYSGSTLSIVALQSDSNVEWNIYDCNAPASSSTDSFIRYRGWNCTGSTVLIENAPCGDYKIVVTISGESSNESYSGSIHIPGIVTKQYKWTSPTGTISFELDFSYDEYCVFRDSNAERTTSADRCIAFAIAKSTAVESIVSEIRALTKGETDADTAAFVLSFVQCCISYPPCVSGDGLSYIMSPDKYMTGHDDYLLYPLETLFRGMGDCEDTAVLSTALFSGLGFDSGILNMPNHVMSLVALNEYAGGNVPSGYGEFSRNIDGKTYYVCETTGDSALRPGLGIELSIFNGHNIQYYLEQDCYEYGT